MTKKELSAYFSAIGTKGGESKSPAKAAAARENGKRRKRTKKEKA